MLTAIARLLSAVLAAVRDGRRKLQDERNLQNARKASRYDRLLAVLEARRKARKQWNKSHEL